MGRWWNDNV